jgi:hypothetical protein
VKKILGTASSIHLPEAGRLVWSEDDDPRSHNTRRSWMMIQRIAPARPHACKTSRLQDLAWGCDFGPEQGRTGRRLPGLCPDLLLALETKTSFVW